MVSVTAKISKILGDGNCLFRSVSFCVMKTQDFHLDIRLRAVDEVIEHWVDYEPFIVGDPTYPEFITNAREYEKLMKSEGVYAGNVELAAISKIFPEYQFRIFDDGNFCSFVTFGGGPKICSLRFTGARDSGHYDVIIFDNEILQKSETPRCTPKNSQTIVSISSTKESGQVVKQKCKSRSDAVGNHQVSAAHTSNITHTPSLTTEVGHQTEIATETSLVLCKSCSLLTSKGKPNGPCCSSKTLPMSSSALFKAPLPSVAVIPTPCNPAGGRPKRSRNKVSLSGRKESEQVVKRKRKSRANATTNHLVPWRKKTGSAFSYRAEINYAEEALIGEMSVLCEYCSALSYRGEADGLCCSSGKVKLSSIELPPDPLRSLLNGDHPDSKEFLHQIRAYNSVFQMTSFGATEISEGHFMPTFKIQGQVYHLIGSLLPEEGNTSKFLQVYFVSDYRSQVDIRMSIVPTLEQHLVLGLQNMLHEINPYVKSIKTALDSLPKDRREDFKIVINADKKPTNEHRGRYNEPSTDEVAVLLVGDNCDRRDIVLRMKDNGLKRISETHRSYDSLQYPLIFPNGDDGYNFSLFQVDPYSGHDTDKKVSALQFYSYRAMIRENESNPLLQYKNLSNQFWVDMYAKIETERLLYIRLNQKKLRAEEYIHLQDALRDNEHSENVGRLVILPSSFTGGPRYMHERTQDAFCYVRKFSRPDLFITITTNPHWEEIQAKLLPGQTAQDRHDIVSRVFRLKLKKLMDLLTKKHIFGETRCYMYSVEWQKRGLPHAHILIWLKEKVRPHQIDKIISAELPNPHEDPELFEIVKRNMIHGPCGHLNPDSPCMKDGKCTKNYPKAFTNATITGDDGYPKYRRRDVNSGGFSTTIRLKKQDVQVDNNWIVPYSPVLSRAFQTHINVEYCNSVKSIKYICKYVNKGSDKACFAVQNKDDEVLRYQSGRYINTSEAIWRTLSFAIHKRYPSVEHLDVHLENFQRVLFKPGNVQYAVENPRKTTLMAFFELCKTDDFARTLLYESVPAYYTFSKETRIFSRRKRGSPVDGYPGIRKDHVLGRVYTVHPNNRECYHLRLLLHHIKGPSSFESLRTVDGTVYNTYQEACKALGLLEDDSHWDQTLFEAKLCDSPGKIRQLFAVMLVFCNMSDPKLLWDKYKDSLSEDVMRSNQRILNGAVEVFSSWVESKCLKMLQDIVLAIGGQPLSNYGLPSPQVSSDTDMNLEYLREISYDREEMRSVVNNNLVKLTHEQRSLFDEVVADVNEESSSKIFFLDAPGGTGKTFLINLLLAQIRGEGKIALAVASSGIAATLLPGGRTAHSAFCVPFDINATETPVCNISKNSNKAKVMKKCAFIVWDECTMSHKKSIEAVERTLRDVLDSDKNFGGITVLFSGDFRQTLPVITRGTRADEVNACLKRSVIWHQIQSRSLTTNMRALLGIDNENAKEFSDLLLRIGNGKEDDSDGFITLTDNLGKHVESIEGLIQKVYHDIESSNTKDGSWLCERAILAPTNEQVVHINNIIIERFQGQEKVYLAVDSIIDQNDAVHYPTEFLNSISAPGLPLYKLKLKTGAPIMLLRNLNPPKLCNGTRLRLKSLQKYIIEAEILTGCGKGDTVLIPRIPVIPSNYPFQFKRLQFPVALCFAMTINKSQGQSLKIAGVDLRSDCFAHGQLYVACSRVSSNKNLFLCCPLRKTRNVVYREAL